jgi:KaiC/GvpD/RAD55 family RecA-like ATPase
MENLQEYHEICINNIDRRLTLILQLINERTHVNGVFMENEDFLELLNLHEEIYKILDKFEDHSIIPEKIAYHLITIVRDVISINHLQNESKKLRYVFPENSPYLKLTQEYKSLNDFDDVVSKDEINSDSTIEKDVYNAVELIALAGAEPPYLMQEIIPQFGTAVLAGKPDTGKSQFARQLCIQIALGEKSFLGFDLNTLHQQAIYVATEDSKEATAYLLNKQFKGLGKTGIENFRLIPADTLSQEEIIKKLEKELKITPADIVVVDSFSDIFVGGDTNNNMAMRRSVKAFDRLAKEYNCLILFVHHINKSAYRLAPGQEGIQGGAGLVQKVRLAMQLSEGEGGIKYFTVVKGNYSPKKYKENSMVLHFSEDTFLFSTKGELIATTEIGTNSGNKIEKYEEDIKLANNLFSDRFFTHTEFVESYCKFKTKSEATAKRVLKKLLELGAVEKHEVNYRLRNQSPEEDNTEIDEIE